MGNPSTAGEVRGGISCPLQEGWRRSLPGTVQTSHPTCLHKLCHCFWEAACAITPAYVNVRLTQQV